MEELRNEILHVVDQEESYKSGAVQYIDSREVAEIIEKEHHKLLRDIRAYINQLRQSKIGFSDFFIESSYNVDGQNRNYPCYLVTRKGCEFIAHKLTGQKGTKFTATYINRFHEMEDKLAGNGNVFPREFVEKFMDFMESQAKANERQANFNRMVLEWFEKAESQSINGTHSVNPFGFSDVSINDERLKELNNLVSEVAELYELERNRTLHFLYKTVEGDLDVSLNSYLAVYRTENNSVDLCMLHVIAANNRLYKKAAELCRDSIQRKRVFG